MILTLTGGLGAALVLGYITHRLGLSPIVGYLLAGLLVGPHTPGFVADSGLAEQLAEIGVILLMFGVGLQFHVEELLAVRRVAVPGAVVQSAVATALGALLAHALGWSWSAGLVFGMALAVASTVVLIRVLADNNDLHTEAGHIAVGWLVVEDLFTVIALVLLPAVFGSREHDTPLWMALGLTAFKVAALVAFTAVVGTRVIPRVLDHVARTRSRELFTLTVLVLALGIAVGSARVFSVSMALGAFLAGMVVGRSEYSLRAASEALPMRDAFAVLFFVSVGMLLAPAALLQSPGLVLGALAIVLVGKPLVALVLVWAFGYPFRASVTVAVALAQIGEFSFILATMGHELGILTTDATNAIVAASIVSIVLNPVAYRMIRPLERWLVARPALWAFLNREPSVPSELQTSRKPRLADPDHRAVVIGYGPTGRTVVAPAARQRHCADGRRAEHRRRARAARRRRGRDLRRRDAARHAGSRRGADGGQPHSRIRGDGQQRGGDPDGAVDESRGSRPGARRLPARRAGAQGRWRRSRLRRRRRGRHRLRRRPARQPRRHSRANRSRACAGPRGAGRAAGVMSVRRRPRPHRAAGGRHEARETSTRRTRRGRRGSRPGCRR